jgi:hypothetical protein
MQQREKREDWKRDKDSIRRYGIQADIDGDTVVVHINKNVLSLHEPKDTEFKSPKFQFIFRDVGDLYKFSSKLSSALLTALEGKCLYCHKPFEDCTCECIKCGKSDYVFNPDGICMLCYHKSQSVFSQACRIRIIPEKEDDPSHEE